MRQFVRAIMIFCVVQPVISGCATTRPASPTADTILDGTRSYDGPAENNSLQVARASAEWRAEGPARDEPISTGFVEPRSVDLPPLTEILSHSSNEPGTAAAPRLPDTVTVSTAPADAVEAVVSGDTRDWYPTGTRPRTTPEAPRRPQPLTPAPQRLPAYADVFRVQPGHKPALTRIPAFARPQQVADKNTTRDAAGPAAAGLTGPTAPPDAVKRGLQEPSLLEIQLASLGTAGLKSESARGDGPLSDINVTGLPPDIDIEETRERNAVTEPVGDSASGSASDSAADPTGNTGNSVGKPAGDSAFEPADSATEAASFVSRSDARDLPETAATSVIDIPADEQPRVRFRGAIQSGSGDRMASIQINGAGTLTVREGDPVPVRQGEKVCLYHVHSISDSSVLLQSADGELLVSQE